MKIPLAFALLLALPAILHAGPILVGSGGGEGEYSVIFARANLQEMLKDCIAFSCDLNSAEKNQAASLLAAAAHPPAAVFKREPQLGSDLFRRSGAEVWINQDRLWLDQLRSVPFDVSEALAMWIEIVSPQTQASIQEKARAAFRRQTTRGRVETSRQTFEYILWKRDGGADQLVVRDPGLQTVDLTPALLEAAGCTGPSRLQVFSPAWMPGPQMNAGVMILNFGLKWSCAGSSGNTTGLASIDAHPGRDGVILFDPPTLFVHIDAGGSHR